MYSVLQSAGKRAGLQDVLCVRLSFVPYHRLSFWVDRAVICYEGGNWDPHGSAPLHGAVHVWKSMRSDVRNPCCEVASFSDVIGMERVD